MRLLALLIFILGLYACQDKQAEKRSSVKNVDNNSNLPGILFETDAVKITGDTSCLKNGIVNVMLKFEPYVSFSDFKVQTVFKGKKSRIDYSSNKVARLFKTKITETYDKSKVNFGGNYCFVYWGCGSPCKQSVIVDLRDGKVYDGPTGERGYEFKSESKMLLVNPPDSLGFYDANCLWCIPHIYEWNEEQKKFEALKPGKD